MSSKYIKKYDIPPGFQDLLSEFTKEILRNQPKDIIDFGIEYFKCLQQGLILDYAHKGPNIPCDFKPCVPKIPASLKSLKNLMIDSAPQISKNIHKPFGQQKQQESKINNQIIEEKVEKKQSTKKIIFEEEKKVEKEEKIEKKIEEKKEDKDKETIEQKGDSPSKDKGSPVKTLTVNKGTNYENCIDFEEKESILNKMKENNEIESEINEYITKDFEPNKQINDLITLLQKTIMSYYQTKGTDKEEEYNKLNEEAQNKINSIKDQYPLFEIDFDAMDSKDALSEFKKYDYYPRILKGYLYKLKHLNDENNELLDEISFFLFVHHLKLIISEEKPSQVLEQKPYLEKYFNHNIQLLSPEIYSFVLGTKYYEDSKTVNLFTSFSFRKRELCHKFYIFYNLKNYGRPEKKKAELLEKYLFVSSPAQILDKIKSANDENRGEIFDTITDKIQQNFPSIWKFISRVVNIPVELITNSFDIFMQFNTTQREIILSYLNLGDDYKDIYNKLSEIKIDSVESNFAYIMEHIYFDLQYVPELNYRSYCIFHNKLFEVPESAKDYLTNIDNVDQQPLDEEKLLKEYEEKNSVVQKGIYLYLLIKDRESPKMEGFIKKIKIIKEKGESLSKVLESEALKENFTLDSDEFIYFKKEYEIWKKDLSPEILEYFKKENDEQKKEYFLSLNTHEKSIVYNLLKIENNNTENGDYENILKEYKEHVPDITN